MSGHCQARCNLRFFISGSEESFIRDSSTSLHFAQNDKMILAIKLKIKQSHLGIGDVKSGF